MNVTVENIASCKKLLRIELDAQAVDTAFADTTKEYQRHAKLPGFRPGKAPKDMVVKRFEKEILDEVKNKLTRDGYQNAIRDNKISVVRLEDVEEVQFGKGQAYQFIATVETAPDFEVPEYKGLAAKRESATVTDADVNRAVTMLRERQTKYDTVERALGDGDVAVVNYKGTCEGKPFTELAPAAQGLTEKDNFWIDVYKDSFIPGFSEQLVGAKAGEKRTVTVDFPADFVTPQLAGKKGVFEVEVTEVKQKVLPELNDELAKSYGAENLDKLREGVRQDLQNEVNMKQQRGLREQVVKGLLDQVQFDLPESVVLQETRNVVYNIVDENTRRGVPKEAIDSQKDQIFASANGAAKDRVKASFIFHKIAEKEGIRVDQPEMLQRIQLMAGQYQMTVDKLIKEMQKNDGIREVHEQLLNEKVINLLLQNAKIEDVAVAPATE